MFFLVGIELTARVQNISAIFANAMNVIADARETTVVELTGFILHELLETITRELFIFDVVTLVFFCNQEREKK